LEFSCAKTDLLGATQIVSRGIPSTTAEPMLLNVFATLADGCLTLLATDNRITIQNRFQVQQARPGRMAVSGHLLLEVLQAIQTSRSDSVTLDCQSGWKVSLVSADARYSLSGFDPDDFPIVPAFEGQTQFSLPGDLLKEMIRKVVVVTSGSMGGMQTYEEVLFEAKDGELTLVATDSVRLAIRSESLEGRSLPELNFLIPSHALIEASRILKGDEEINWDVSEDQAAIRSGTTELRARLSDKTFPNFRMILPKSQSRNLRVNTREFRDSLKGVIPLAREIKDKVYIEFESDRLIISSTSIELGEARREMEVSLEGEPIKLAFNGKYLLDFLSVIDTETFRWGMTSATYPATLTPDSDGSTYTYILMPITH